MGEKLVDKGSPIKQASGFAVQNDGVSTDVTSTVNGYGIIQARDKDHAIELVKTHPFLTHGSEYKIEVFELGQ